MDTASLYQGLTFLAWTSVAFLIIVGVFIVKVLFDFSRLLGLLNQTATLLKDSAKPILSDITESVSIINKLVKRTENNVNRFKNIAAKTSKVVLGLISKTSAFSGIIAKGIFDFVKSLLKK